MTMHRQSAGSCRNPRHAALTAGVLSCIAIAVLLIAAPARGQTVPDGSIAWWRFDPSRFASPAQAAAARSFIETGLRAAAGARVLPEEQAALVLEGVLAASIVGGSPHTLVLLNLETHRDEATGDIVIDDCAAVLEIRTNEDHRSLVRTIRAILIDAERAKGEPGAGEGAQRVLDLPGGRQGVAFREIDRPAWREVSWASSPGVFTVALGEGALERWFLAQDAPPDETRRPWTLHSEVVGRARPPGEIFHEAYLDLDALRRRSADAFAEGRVRDTARALSLSNARSLMTHARWIEPADVRVVASGADAAPQETYQGPPMIALDATWSVRSEPPSEVRRQALSESVWPGGRHGVRLPPPPGTFVIVARSQWGGWLQQCLEIYRGAIDLADRAEFERARARWQSAQRGRLAAVQAAAGPWVVLSNFPPPIVPIPGSGTLYVPLAPGADAQALVGNLQALLSPFADRLAFDAERNIWTLRADAGGVLRVISFGICDSPAGPVLVGGIDVGLSGGVTGALVEQNRAWLARPPDP